MKIILKFYNWFREPWPLHLIIVFMLFHLFLHEISPLNKERIDAYFSALYQIIGGLLILWSINQNLNVLSKRTLKSVLVDWIKRFPIFPKSTTINLSSSIVGISATGKVAVTRHPSLTTIDEKVSFLFKEVERIDQKINNSEKSLREEMIKVVAKNSENHKKVNQDIAELRKNINSTIVGGVKLEVLGVLTAIYGIIIPVI